MSSLTDKDIASKIQKKVKEHLEILAGKITCILLELDKEELVDILDEKEKLLANIEECVSILHNYRSENEKDFESRKLKRAHFSLMTKTMKPRFLDVLTKLRFQDDKDKNFYTMPSFRDFDYPQSNRMYEDVIKLGDKGGGIVIIRHLDDTITEEELYDTFISFGNLLYCKIFKDGDNEHQRIGILHYETKEAGNEAIQKVNDLLIENELKDDLDETEHSSGGHLLEKVMLPKFQKSNEDTNTLTRKESSTQTLMPAEQLMHIPPLLPSPIMINPRTSIEQKQMIGERLFPLVQEFQPTMAGKITGILLEKYDDKELFEMLQNRELLASKIEEANKLYMKYKRKTFLSNGVNQIKVEIFDEKLKEHDLFVIFKDFGEVFSIHIMKNETVEKNKSFALIQLTTKEAVETAIQKIDGLKFNDTTLSVTKYNTQPEEEIEGVDGGGNDEEDDDLLDKVNFVPGVLHPNHPSIQQQQQMYQQHLHHQRIPTAGQPGFYIPTMAQDQRTFIAQSVSQLTRPRWQSPQVRQMQGGYSPVGQVRAPANNQRPRHSGGFQRRDGGYNPSVQQASARNQYPPQQSEPILQEPHTHINASLLATSTPSEQKQMIGERIFPLVQEFQPTMAGKITGILLEKYDNKELFEMLQNRELLASKIEEANKLYMKYKKKTFLSNGVNQMKVESFGEKLKEHDLFVIFKDFGEVFSIHIMQNETVEKNKSFALIQLTTKEAVETAIQKIDGLKFNDTTLSVTKYTQPEEEIEDVDGGGNDEEDDDFLDNVNFVPGVLHPNHPSIQQQQQMYQQHLHQQHIPTGLLPTVHTQPGFYHPGLIVQPRAACSSIQYMQPHPQQLSKKDKKSGGGLLAFASLLATATPSQQKQMIGERLFPLVQEFQPTMAGKITGMMLEIDNSKLLHMLEHRELFAQKVEEAVQVLQAHQAKEAKQSASDSDED